MSTTMHLFLLRFDVRPSFPVKPWNQICTCYALNEQDAHSQIPETRAELSKLLKVNENAMRFDSLQAMPGGFQATPDSHWYPGTIEMDQDGNPLYGFPKKIDQAEAVSRPLRLRKRNS